MPHPSLRERIEELEAAASGPVQDLATVNSPESARSAADGAFARTPYLRVSDLIALRTQDIRDLDQLEQHILEVPDEVWPRVLDLVRSRIVHVEPHEIQEQADELGLAVTEDDPGRCLALTKAGDRCRNPARSGAKYCASHKGYQPSEEELEARKEGLLPEA